jgi:hypothetical protein
MDGTLSDTRSIRHYVQGTYRNFDMFHRTSLWTPPNPEVLKMVMQAHEAGLAIAITTARSEPYREVTQAWLDDLNVPYENIFMRKADDYRHDYLVKDDMLKDVRKYYDVVAATDDNPQAVSTWRKNGIRVTVVPGFEEGQVSDFEVIQINNPITGGACLRCGRPLKGGGVLGPECSKIA